MMKTREMVLGVLCLLVFAGCESVPETSAAAVRLGLSRNDLRLRFGEPLRIARVASGGEDWYYRFVTWTNGPTATSETNDSFGERSTSVSVGWNATRTTEEQPIHLSPEGYVIEPLPSGKVLLH